MNIKFTKLCEEECEACEIYEKQERTRMLTVQKMRTGKRNYNVTCAMNMNIILKEPIYIER